MRGLYLICLLSSIFGLALCDYRWKLAYFKNPKLTIKLVAIGVLVFLLWDIAGIIADIFFIGTDKYLVGIEVGEVPLEEVFFLILLNYNSLVAYNFIKRRRSK